MESARPGGGLQLALKLRHLRVEAGLTVAMLANRLGQTQSWLSKIELGQISPSYADLERLADALNLEPFVRNELFKQAGPVAQSPDSHDSERFSLSEVLELERSSRSLRSLQFAVIHRLLQLPSYTEAVLARHPAMGTYYDEVISQRLQRQATTFDTDKSFHIIIAESGLDRGRVPVEVMQRQYQYLIERIKRQDRLRIGILPVGSTALVPHLEFTVHDDRAVVIETLNETHVSYDPEEVEKYRRAFDEAAAQSQYGEDALALVAAAAESDPNANTGQHPIIID